MKKILLAVGAAGLIVTISAGLVNRPKLANQNNTAITSTPKSDSRGGDEKTKDNTEEAMPDVRVTHIKSEFIPYETDEKGSCSGPYLNLVFTVSNRGADFPRKADLDYALSRMIPPHDKLNFLTVVASMDFGNKEISQKLLSVDRTKFPGDKLGGGSSIQVPLKLKIENNQTQLHISAKVEGGSFLKTGNGQAKYGSDIAIPIWDIYTESNATAASTGDGGRPAITTRTKITNKGKTRTPGAVEGYFTIRYSEDGPSKASWDGKTDAAIGPGAVGEILSKKSVPEKIEGKFLVESTLILLCPDGNPGTLSDGNFENNKRTLHQ
jgi:hypothetical protein